MYLMYMQKGEEGARGWMKDDNLTSSFCPSHFAPSIPALAEALNEHPKPLLGTCPKGEQETDPSSDHDPQGPLFIPAT